MKICFLNLNNFSLKLNDPISSIVISLYYSILSSIVRTFFKENYDEILHAHYTWKIPEKGIKINWVMP
jgi:hypothetical protein